MSEAAKGEAAAAAASPRFGGDKPAIDWEDRVRREKGWHHLRLLDQHPLQRSKLPEAPLDGAGLTGVEGRA